MKVRIDFTAGLLTIDFFPTEVIRMNVRQNQSGNERNDDGDETGCGKRVTDKDGYGV